MICSPSRSTNRQGRVALGGELVLEPSTGPQRPPARRMPLLLRPRGSIIVPLGPLRRDLVVLTRTLWLSLVEMENFSRSAFASNRAMTRPYQAA
jgi:hypothetical protein